jgi:hypothetical protein
VAKQIPATLILHGPTALMVMHCDSLDAAKAAVLPIVRKRGGDEALKSLGIYNDGRMYEWSDERGRGYTAYVAETPTGELIEIH